MRQVRWASWMVGMAMALAVGGAGPAAADVRSDQAAAILEWPSVVAVSPTDVVPIIGITGITLDTVIQLTNTSTAPAYVHCFYENANSHCTNTGQVCEVAEQCCGPMGCGICQAGWNETDFNIVLTPRQPLGWVASEGMQGFDQLPNFVKPLPYGEFPLGGNFGSVGPDQTSSNAGSNIPGVPELPFNGSLRCIVVNQDHQPIDQNVIKGEATIELFLPEPIVTDDDVVTVAKANAVGIQAIPGANDNDNVLCLGGSSSDECPNGPEYNGCPNILILDAFSDFAIDPISDSEVVTALTLVPCTQDFLRQIPGDTKVQFLVYNEFEQRFSTSEEVKCKTLQLISNIDTTQNDRSIFQIGQTGTLTVQIRMSPLTQGVLGVATEIHLDDNIPIADTNLHYQGDRDTADIITLPPP